MVPIIEADYTNPFLYLQDNTVQNVYDEVDEDEYNDIVNQRQRDDFVVDDGAVIYLLDFLVLDFKY